MITAYFFSIIAIVLSALLSWLPNVTELPLGMDYYFSLAFGYFRTVEDIFPFLATIFNAFLFYFFFKMTLLVLKLLKII